MLPSAGSVGRFRPWRALGSQVADPVRDLELLLLPLLLLPEAPPPLESWGTSGAVNTDTIRYDTIRDAVLKCAQKPTQVTLIYRTEPTTKKWKTAKLKSKKTDVLSKQSGKSVESVQEKKRKAAVGRICRKGMF